MRLTVERRVPDAEEAVCDYVTLRNRNVRGWEVGKLKEVEERTR